jgi:hypothetical protein
VPTLQNVVALLHESAYEGAFPGRRTASCWGYKKIAFLTLIELQSGSAAATGGWVNLGQPGSMTLHVRRQHSHGAEPGRKHGHLVWGVPAVMQRRGEELRGAYEKEGARSEREDDCMREQRGLPPNALAHAPANCNSNGRH